MQARKASSPSCPLSLRHTSASQCLSSAGQWSRASNCPPQALIGAAARIVRMVDCGLYLFLPCYSLGSHCCFCVVDCQGRAPSSYSEGSQFHVEGMTSSMERSHAWQYHPYSDPAAKQNCVVADNSGHAPTSAHQLQIHSLPCARVKAGCWVLLDHETSLEI